MYVDFTMTMISEHIVEITLSYTLYVKPKHVHAKYYVLSVKTFMRKFMETLKPMVSCHIICDILCF